MKLGKSTYRLLLLATILSVTGLCCRKQLEEKPNSIVLEPTTPIELQGLLDNVDIFSYGHALGILSADELFFQPGYYDKSLSTSERNAYTWQQNIFDPGEVPFDWARFYQQIYYANIVLERINTLLSYANNDSYLKRIKGDALFKRAIAHFQLLQLFAPGYAATSAATDLGIPLKLRSDEDEVIIRPSLQECYDQILADLVEAQKLLQVQPDPYHPNRASQVAASALLARVYLCMGSWQQSIDAAEAVIQRYDSLVNYNLLDSSLGLPLQAANKEIIYLLKAPDQSGQNALVLGLFATGTNVDTNLIKLYGPNDRRLSLYFHQRTTSKTWTVRPGFTGTFIPFEGISISEVYLTLAESYAWLGKPDLALTRLEKLLRNRYTTNANLNLPTANQPEAVLDRILTERKKEIPFRGLRWMDIKRLNRQNRTISQQRIVNGAIYTIAPNDPRYALPLPVPTVNKYQLQQNPR